MPDGSRRDYNTAEQAIQEEERGCFVMNEAKVYWQ
jgi:hypothetical protein